MTKRRSTDSPPLVRKRQASSASQSLSDSLTSGMLTPDQPPTASATISDPTQSKSDRPKHVSTSTIEAIAIKIPTLHPDNMTETASAPPAICQTALSRDLREISYDGTVVLPEPEKRNLRILPTALVPYIPPYPFPIFQDGNIIINIQSTDTCKTFQLHSTVLAGHSSFFTRAFQEYLIESAQPTCTSFTIREVEGHIQFQHQTVPSDQMIATSGMYIKTEPPDNDDGLLNAQSIMASSRDDHFTTIAHYTELFGMFYQIEPIISTIDIGTTLIRCEELLKLGTYFECLPLVRLNLRGIFNSFRKILFLAIKADPARWLVLAKRLQDTSIYTESLIHLIGAHPSWPWPTSRTALSPETLALIAQRSAELDLACLKANQDLFFTTIEIKHGRNRAPRPVVCEPGSMKTWHVIQIFRNTLSNALREVDNSNYRSLRMGALYRKISKGGSAYLAYEDVRTTCLTILTAEWKDLGVDLDSLKEFASSAVADVAANELMIDPDMHGIGYLTCAKVGKEDIPW